MRSEHLIVVNEAGILSATLPRLHKRRVHTGDVGFECRKESGRNLVLTSLTSLSVFISHRILIRFHGKPTGNPVTGVNGAQSGCQETTSDNVHSPPYLEVKGKYNTSAAWLVCSTQESTKFTTLFFYFFY